MHENDLVGVDRRDIADMAMVVLILMLSGVSLVSVASSWPDYITVINVAALAVVSFIVAFRLVIVRPDHLRAQQSDLILRIAREALSYMREGLNLETADAVCKIVLRNSTDAVSVALTNRVEVLGFVGVGNDHHSAGRPIVTRATQETINSNISQILGTKEEIGCPDPACPLTAVIIVPLQARGQSIGTLKFYYTSDRYLNETELAMAEGLASLLSTQLEVHELEEQAALTTEMELKVLQAQINPHFLFNTLNTIAVFIRTDPAVARDLLRRFAKFYRYTLEHADEEITLRVELGFLEEYFALEKARFGDRLIMDLDVEESLLGMPMPAFMLQPLVENCVAHGMRESGKPLHIHVSAHRRAGRVVMCVEDDGVGIPKKQLETIFDKHTGKGLGIALRNVRDRVSGVFGAESEFVIESDEGQGTRACFLISERA
ncbi:MAG: histidine kinase [Coriobacteriia bacterium]|nr:histidine kinase [Coriobacteriia bacterium]